MTGEGVVRAPFWIWSREASAASTLKSLQADTVLLCYSTNTEPYSVTLHGTPVAPRIVWHVSDDTSNTDFRNMFGVRLSGPSRRATGLPDVRQRKGRRSTTFPVPANQSRRPTTP